MREIKNYNVHICAVDRCVTFKKYFCRYPDLTHAQKQALVLLDGTQATEKACYHDDGADGNDHIGS